MANDYYREFRLNNGLLVALKETPTQTVAGKLRIHHSALNEMPGEEGLAHFLEHNLMSGGSKKLSPEECDNIRNFFGMFNAYTSRNQMYFPVDMLKDDTPLFFEFVSEITMNPRFDQSRFNQEKQRVLREISDKKSKPDFKDNNEYRDAIFGKNSPHNYFVLGEESVIESSSVQSIKKFHQRGFNPSNMDLILVGALPNNIETLVEQNFGSLPAGNVTKIELPKNNLIDGPHVLYNSAPDLLNKDNPNNSSAVVSMAMYAPNGLDPETFAVELLTKVLGGDTNSKLFKSVSQQKGLAYSIKSGYDYTKNHGLILVLGKIHAPRFEDGIDAIFEEMNKLKSDLVSEEHLNSLKRDAHYRIAKHFEQNNGRLTMIEYLLDGTFSPEQYLDGISKVTPEMIRDVARKYFPSSRVDGNYVLSIRDPLKK